MDKHDGLVVNGMKFLIDNEIFTEPVLNNLILFGFNVSNAVIDVEFYIDEKNKKIFYELTLSKFKQFFMNKAKAKENLISLVKSGLKEYDVIVTYK